MLTDAGRWPQAKNSGYAECSRLIRLSLTGLSSSSLLESDFLSMAEPRLPRSAAPATPVRQTRQALIASFASLNYTVRA